MQHFCIVKVAIFFQTRQYGDALSHSICSIQQTSNFKLDLRLNLMMSKKRNARIATIAIANVSALVVNEGVERDREQNRANLNEPDDGIHRSMNIFPLNTRKHTCGFAFLLLLLLW